MQPRVITLELLIVIGAIRCFVFFVFFAKKKKKKMPTLLLSFFFLSSLFFAYGVFSFFPQMLFFPYKKKKKEKQERYLPPQKLRFLVIGTQVLLGSYSYGIDMPFATEIVPTPTLQCTGGFAVCKRRKHALETGSSQKWEGGGVEEGRPIIIIKNRRQKCISYMLRRRSLSNTNYQKYTDFGMVLINWMKTSAYNKRGGGG